LVVSLADPDFHTEGPWAFARGIGARYFGMIAIKGLEGAPELPVLWTFSTNGTIDLVVADDEPNKGLPPGLQDALYSVMGQFFGEVEPALKAVKPMGVFHAAPTPRPRSRPLASSRLRKLSSG
jgi:hypothetical protein